MVRMNDSIEIAAPADEVWEVIGPGFARVGEWATPVPHSAELARHAVGDPTDAPVTERSCATTLKGFESVTETITAYDAVRRTLTYRVRGLPRFVTDATNTWVIEEAGPGRSRASIDGRMRVTGAGRMVAPMLAWTLRKNARLVLEDLRHYVEQGAASPRKQRQLAQRAAAA